MHTSRTSIENSHSNERAWKTVIEHTLVGYVSMDETAEKIGGCSNTVFNMRHKILLTLESYFKGTPIVLQYRKFRN